MRKDERIERYTIAMSEHEFLKREEIQDAVVRRIEMIGEAVRGSPRRLRRSILIHEYFDMTLERVWETVKNDLPQLEAKISRILNEKDT